MRKARAESQVLPTIDADAGSCHGISKLENVPHVPYVPPANGKARSTPYDTSETRNQKLETVTNHSFLPVAFAVSGGGNAGALPEKMRKVPG